MSIEVIMITRRPFPIGILKTLNWQTDKDFVMRILVRGPQPWTPEELKASLEFPVEIYPQKLYFSTGTRYGAGLAWNEVLTYVESDYVLFTEDYSVINPRAVEVLREYARPDVFMQGGITVIQSEWRDDFDYVGFKPEFDGIKRQYHMAVYQGEDLNDKGELVSLSHGFRTAFNFFPMEALERVNGLDVAFDTQWGMIDINLAWRLLRAGYKFGALYSLGIYMFKHAWHENEKDDSGIGGPFCIYNKSTGAKIMNPKTCKEHGGGDTYNWWCKENNIIEAPLGLKQIRALM